MISPSIYVLRLVAENDHNGNPRRCLAICHTHRGILVAVRESYGGDHEVFASLGIGDDDARELRRRTLSVRVPPAEVRRTLAGFPADAWSPALLEPEVRS